MAQSTAGTNLPASWAASARRPCAKLEVQWDRTTWTDETSRLLSYTVDRSLYNEQIGLPGLAAAPSAKASLTLDNRDGRYSPSNAASPLHAYIQEGIYRIPVRLSAGYYAGETPEMLRQFTGEIEGPQAWEDTSGRSVVFNCLDMTLPLLQTKGSTTVYPDVRPDTFIHTLLTLGLLGMNDRILNPGFETQGSGGEDVFANWTEEANDGAIIRTTAAGEYHSGAAAVKLTQGATNYARVYQVCEATVGQSMRLSFWTRGNGSAAGRYQVWDVDNSANIIAQTSTGVSGAGWSEVVVVFTVPAGCTHVEPLFYSPATAGAWACFDDVSLTGMPPSFQADPGMSRIPYAWLDDENIWAEIGNVAQADGGMVYCDEFGAVRYERMTHWQEAVDHTAVQATLDRGKCWWLEDALSWRDCYTKVIVETSPRYLMATTELYNAPDAIEVGPGSTVERVARLRWPNYGLVAPVAGTDYTCVNGAMIDMASALSISMTQYGQRVNLRFTNSDSNYTLYALDFKLRGVPLAGDESQEEERRSGMGKIPGEKDFAIRGNPYIQTAEQAGRLAGFLRDRLERPRRLLNWKGPACPWLQLGDRVRVVDAPTGIDMEGYVVSREDEYGGEWGTTLLVLPAATLFPHLSYFRLGVSAWADVSDPVFY